MKAWGLGNFFSSLAVPVGLQKRLLSFLLQRAIGHFLEDDLDLEKLDIELSNGIVHLTDLKLNTTALNDLVAGTPFSVAQGRIKSITATIPWRNLWNGQCVLEIDGIDMALAPVKAQSAPQATQDEQVLSSSVDLANDFLHQQQQQQVPGKEEAALQESLLQTFQSYATHTPSGFPGDFNSRPATSFPPGQSSSLPTDDSSNVSDQASDGEGIQFVAKLIEKLMGRIQIICKGTVIRLRHNSSLPLVKKQFSEAPKDGLDYELEIRLPYIAYRDETPGWDQLAGGMDASSIRSSSSGLGSESTSNSTLLEESIMPSVIWQDSPESIKTVMFRGFSVWIKEQGKTEHLVAQSDPIPNPVPDSSSSAPTDDQDNSESDSDTDVFSDAQDHFSHSMMASQMISRKAQSPLLPSPLISASASQVRSDLYAAEIVSTLQHKNRVKVNIRKNMQTANRTLLDIDFHIRSIFIALSPNQIAFMMEILALMDTAPAAEIPGVCPDRAAAKDMERPLTQSQILSSPRRAQTAGAPRVTQLRSPGSRPLDVDRGTDLRHLRATTPPPAVYMDSSRFLGGSVYGDTRSGAGTPSASVPSSTASPLTIKLKARISTLQVYVLYQDPESFSNIPTEASFFKSPSPEALRASHLKLELDGMVLRYQQWATNNSGQKASKSSKGQIDFTLSNFMLAEWIDQSPRPFDTTRWDLPSDQYRVPPHRRYIPLVEFDAEQDSPVQTSPTSKLPVLQVPDRYLSERDLLLKSKKNKRHPEGSKPTMSSMGESSAGDKDASSGIIKELVRMRIQLGGKKDSSGSNNSSSTDPAATSLSSGFAQDVTIEVKPFHIHLDLHTFKRLEMCLLAIMGSNQKTATPPSDPVKDIRARSQRSMEQQIMDDLDGPRRVTKAKTRLRLRLNSVQVWISVPDMASTLAGQLDTGPEYRSIYDVVALNLSKVVVTRGSDGSKSSSQGHDAIDPATSKSADGHAPKIKVDFSSVSAFVIPAHASPVVPAAGFSNSVPSLEISMRTAGSLPVLYERPSSTGFPRTPALQAFAILEGEENVHNAVDEEEELLHFKQRTVETSLLVIDTHFPLVSVHLEKKILDTLQLRINDLSTWMVIFSEQLAAQLPAPPVSAPKIPTSQDRFAQPGVDCPDPKDDRRSSLDGDPRDGRRGSFESAIRDDHSEHGTDQSTAYGEELRHQAEGSPSAPRARVSRDYQYQPKLVQPTMASVLLSAQIVEVILDYPTAATVLEPVSVIKSYQITVGDAKVFAAAKYQGGTDTYLCVDAEDLEFWEITAQKPKALLLTRTVPKTIKLKTPGPMFHMTSLLSFDPVIMFKENDTNLAFSGISWKFSIDQTAVDDVQDFFAEPVGIVYYNPPRQCTRVRVSLSECCMDYKPLHIPSRFVLAFEKMKVFSTLIPESPTLKSKVQIYNMNLFLIDRPQSIQTPHHVGTNSTAPGIDPRQYWRSIGFAQIGQCGFFELRSVKSKNGQLPLYDLLVTNNVFFLETCSDSFETLLQLAAYLGDNGDMPIEKKKILERLAEAERAANRAKSNVIYQDVLLASLDEDAFRKPSIERQLDTAGTLDFVEGFYSVEREDSENDLFKAQMLDTPNIDGFHEVYADLLGGPELADKNNRLRSPKEKDAKSKAKGKAPVRHVEPGREHDSQLHDLKIPIQAKPSRQPSVSSPKRDGPVRPRSLSKTDSQVEGILRILDEEALFSVNENYFSIPILTEEERAKEEGSLAKLRLRVRDFNFSWKLFDGLDWEISRVDEAERKRQARQLANRLYDPNDVIHTTMDSAQSNLEASIFERLSGVQASPHTDRQGGGAGHSRRDLSPSSSEADSMSDYQGDVMSQVGGHGGHPSSTSSVSGSRRSPQHQQNQGLHHQQNHQHHHTASHQDRPKRSKKLERSKTAMIEFNADKVRLDFEDYLPGVETASHLSVRVRQFEIIDNLKTSLWHKFLSHQRQDSHTATPRLTQSNMIRIDLDGVRPVVSASTVEHRLKLRILPLRLYIDQDALIFLIKFFVQSNSTANASASDEVPPESVAAVHEGSEKKPNEMYFQSVKMGELSVKMDYKPKHVDYTGLTGGNFVELMNFFHLDAAEMTLQEVRLHGINGFAKLGQELISSWLPHIRSTQVPHMVSGLTPIRSLVNLGSGIADLVLLPIEQYKRDGHIIRGLQKGGQAFTRATTLEALKIGTRLAVGTQVLLEHADEIFGSSTATGPTAGIATAGRDYVGEGDDAYDGHGGKRVVATMVSDSEAYMQESLDEDQLLRHLQYEQQHQQYNPSGSSSSPGSLSVPGAGSKAGKLSKYANQPADINEGMELAYKSLSKNIGTAAHTIFAVPMEVYERTGAQGSVRAVIRAVPVAVLKPMIGATEAFSKVLIGLRNSIDPAQRLQMEDKYKRQ
ncbi:autophagy- protein 2 [Dissophora globulifera]|uniref:Autophagy-related protein 2 n=1 Tax=Dissophora globulifera TaxID=979702 RepID=A0A9P6UYE9_9FUNG|nr:autophagy- protein 2 [Dissophora globulifera]